MLLLQWREVDMRGNTFTRDFGVNLLAGLPRNTVVLSSGDLFRHSLQYAQACLGVRPDLTVVDQELLFQPWYRRQLVRRRALRLTDAEIAPGAESGLDSRTLLEWISRPLPGGSRRPAVLLKLPEDGEKVPDRLLPLGIWSRVMPKDAAIDVREWTAASAEVRMSWAENFNRAWSSRRG